MWEFGEDLWRILSSRLACKWTTLERPHEKHMLESEQFSTSCMSRVTLQLNQVTSDPLNLLPKPFWNVFFSFLHQHHIKPHYPQNCKELLREKTLAIHLRVRDCKPTIIYTISLSCPLLLPFQLQILKRSLAQILISLILSVERRFGSVGRIGRSHWMADAIWS